ncbi:DeoR/GlpR family transcriptional regulator of sugar metabolism [Gracilibacillus alcaliphilus]|nr:DeoR/GlpR family transcriptional regulator of sugar metabolism [Gracilibacillus alcaliphilus]
MSAKGLSTANPEVSIFHKTIYNNSIQKIALIEHTKIGMDMFAGKYPNKELDLIITDEETSKQQIKTITAQGTKVIVAKRRRDNVLPEKILSSEK